MILMYHKIHPDSPSMWWVHVDEFYRHLCELRNKQVVFLEDYDANDSNQAVITFDGVYKNVLEFAVPLLKKFQYPFEVFIVGDHVGGDNSFDVIDKRTNEPTGEPLTEFANKEDLQKIIESGGRLQWHTKSHPNLTTIATNEISRELNIPKALKKLDPLGFTWFAYPHGEWNDVVVKEVKKKFSGAVSVIQGDSSNRYALNRITVTNDTRLKTPSIGVIIPSYNYGSFLVESIESVLKQTRLPDKVLIVNDGSTDNTDEIAQIYVAKNPKISYLKNEKNLGIVQTFNTAVKTIATDYIVILGADNRMMSNYLEETSKILDQDSKIAVAYTDFILFGSLASAMFSRMPSEIRGTPIQKSLYPVHFPQYSKKIANDIQRQNFIHGSSMYRYTVFEKVGGYFLGNQAEDHNLFSRIISSGWKAKKASNTYLEYRQHSRTQTNTQRISHDELLFYKKQFSETRSELEKIKSSKFWKLLYLYKNPRVASKRFAKAFLRKVFQKILNAI